MQSTGFISAPGLAGAKRRGSRRPKVAMASKRCKGKKVGAFKACVRRVAKGGKP